MRVAEKAIPWQGSLSVGSVSVEAAASEEKGYSENPASLDGRNREPNRGQSRVRVMLGVRCPKEGRG